MKATCQIHRPDLPDAAGGFDVNTGRMASDPNPTLIYDGICRITPTRGDREMAVGDEVILLRDTDFYLPFSAPLPIVDDLITVTTAVDLTLVGRVWRITDVRVGETNVARKVSGVSLSPSRTSDNITPP